MAAAPLTLEARHAIDAPFDNPDEWCAELVPGICTACGQDAYAGTTGWWHLDHHLCPERHLRVPRFSADS